MIKKGQVYDCHICNNACSFRITKIVNSIAHEKYIKYNNFPECCDPQDHVVDLQTHIEAKVITLNVIETLKSLKKRK